MVYQVLPAAGLGAIMTFCGYMVVQLDARQQQAERDSAAATQDIRAAEVPVDTEPLTE
jgi:hypothetical protein